MTVWKIQQGAQLHPGLNFRYNLLTHMNDNVAVRIAVYGFILNQNKKILLIERAAHDSFPGMWEMPGGKLEFTEQPAQGALREVFEETQLKVRCLQPISVYSSFKKQYLKQVVRIAFLCEMEDNQQQVHLSPDHSNFNWADLNELPDKLSKFSAYTIQMLKEQKVL